MEIKQLKKELGLRDKDIAEIFSLNPMTYANSSAKKRYETALCRFYDVVQERWQKGKEKGITANDGEPT